MVAKIQIIGKRWLSSRTTSSLWIEKQKPVELTYTPYPGGHGQNAAENLHQGRPLVILHGLFGSKQNWRSLSKALSGRLGGRMVYAVDLRNHGESPHREEMGFDAMAADVAHFILRRLKENGVQDVDKGVDILGHSMGGKVAMHLALRAPEMLHRLVVEDIAPVQQSAELGREIERYVELMQQLERQEMWKNRAAAAAWLEKEVGNPAISAFLLTNLKKKVTQNKSEKEHKDFRNKSIATINEIDEIDTHRGPVLRWQHNLSAISRALPALWQFPLANGHESSAMRFEGPTLFIGGERSGYLRPQEHKQEVQRWFADSRIVQIRKAGHWVHVDQPTEFVDIVAEFLR